VDSRALIPRPETGELLEYIREKVIRPPQRIIDLGTGSGAIAIALAVLFPDAAILATDQSGDALALAEENAQRCGVRPRIEFLQGNWWEAVPGDQVFDLIVSNPPYLTEEEMATAEPEVAANEPTAALVSGKDGLDDLRRILAETSRYLAPGGSLALETGIAQHEALQDLCRASGLTAESIRDLSGRPRFCFAQNREDQAEPEWHSVQIGIDE
jgi:release factor glutamine methyltransferase